MRAKVWDQGEAAGTSISSIVYMVRVSISCSPMGTLPFYQRLWTTRPIWRWLRELGANPSQEAIDASCSPFGAGARLGFRVWPSCRSEDEVGNCIGGRSASRDEGRTGKTAWC